MLKLRTSSIFKYLIASICTLSVLMGPAKAEAVDYYPEDEQTACDSCCWTGSAAPIIGGALLLGGIAVLAADHHRDGSTGSPGNTGDTGETGSSFDFPYDEGEYLAFAFPDEDYNIDLVTRSLPSPQSITSITVTPFVVAPDGECFEGESLITTYNPNYGFSLPPIVIEDPIFGTYHVGFQIRIDLTDDDQIEEVHAVLRVDVFSSRDDDVTRVQDDQNFCDLSDYGNEFQVTADFSYCPENSSSSSSLVDIP